MLIQPYDATSSFPIRSPGTFPASCQSATSASPCSAILTSQCQSTATAHIESLFRSATDARPLSCSGGTRTMHHERTTNACSLPRPLVDRLPRADAAGAGLYEVGCSALEKLGRSALTPAGWPHRVVRQWQHDRTGTVAGQLGKSPPSPWSGCPRSWRHTGSSIRRPARIISANSWRSGFSVMSPSSRVGSERSCRPHSIGNRTSLPDSRSSSPTCRSRSRSGRGGFRPRSAWPRSLFPVIQRLMEATRDRAQIEAADG